MIPSPCNKVCTLDPASGWCIGCGRTGEEIGAWIMLDDAARAALVAELPARLRQLASRTAEAAQRRAGAAPR
jgi:predicted Fe-S protein YdhL (DUF1289 family)